MSAIAAMMVMASAMIQSAAVSELGPPSPLRAHVC